MNHEETEMLINLFHSAVDRSRSDSLGNPIVDNSVPGSGADDLDEYQKLMEGLIGSVGEAKKNKRKRTDSLNATTMDCEVERNSNAVEKGVVEAKAEARRRKFEKFYKARRNQAVERSAIHRTLPPRRIEVRGGIQGLISCRITVEVKKGRCQAGDSHVVVSTSSHADCEESDNSRSSRSSSTSLGEKSPASSATDCIGEEEVGNNGDYLSDSELKDDEFSSSKASFRNNRDSPNKGNNTFVTNATLGKKIHFDTRAGERSGDESGGDLTPFASNDSNSSAQTVKIDSRQRNDRRHSTSTRPRNTKARNSRNPMRNGSRQDNPCNEAQGNNGDEEAH